MKKIPNRIPYLKTEYIELNRNSWYKTYYFNKEVTKEQFTEWFAVIFKKANIKTLEQARNLFQYQLNSITKTNNESYVRIYGAYFDCMCVQRRDVCSLQWFDQNILKGEDTLQKRFDYVMDLINKQYFDEKEN